MGSQAQPYYGYPKFGLIDEGSEFAVLTSIGANKKVYMPTVSEIKDMYYKMFCGKKAHTAKDRSVEAGTSVSHGGLSNGEANSYAGSAWEDHPTRAGQGTHT